MHVALLSNEYPPFIFGGIGTFAKNLAYGLSKCGVKVTVISGYPSYKRYLTRHGVEIQSENGITILRYAYPNIPPRHTAFQLANFRSLYDSIREIDADVIHGQSGSTFPLLLKLKNFVPVVTTFHTSPKAEKSISCYSLSRGGSFKDIWTYVIGYPFWSYTFREELQNSTLAIAVSKTLKSDLLDEMGQAFTNRIQEIHNGIDVETLDKEYSGADESVEDADRTILFAGRMFWRKGVLNIVQLAYWLQKNHSDFKIIAHGDGPLLNTLRCKIRDFGLTNVELRGFTSKKQLIKSMKSSRFVVVPSYYEACPMILLESMCLGKIPIMLDLPFAQEFTDCGRYGILSNGIRDLASKLERASGAMDIDNLSNDIRCFARAKYDIKKISLNYIKAYQKACSNTFGKCK
jgi:glycosyltransferase involved in cell wall biosynthesis